MFDCTGCCSACKPPWIRHVDNIYPANPQDGLMKNNMSKLTFYALSHPQKLDRIGEYLSKRLNRDLSRNKIVFVTIAMEAMDQLLVACHSQSLNLFVESFLKMVQKLLECADPDVQCLATVSFVKFSNIEEDTPSYHRRYDFFVSQFSAMCHSNHLTAKHRIRTAGIQGIQGVIRKTVCDELRPDIWEQHHMDKIVPSLLYNMHCREGTPSVRQSEETAPDTQAQQAAEKVFRDLVCRAAFNNLKSVLRPVLSHIDSHNLWETSFPSSCFKIIMYSVQAQYGHVVVQMLMSHLDSHNRSPAALKASITNVLSETVVIAAGGSIGPSILDLFNSLIKHLKGSVEYKSTSDDERQANSRFQESIINTIGEFANHLPDFQKIEILMFVINKMPLPQNDSESSNSALLQTILLKTILKVATTYRTVLMSNAFPSGLKNPLLQTSLVNRPSTRMIVQKILHTLIDRHDNTEKFSKVWLPEDIAELDLVVEKPSRQDIYFMKHGGSHLLWHLLENFRLKNNTSDNMAALYCTMCLLLVELTAEETQPDFASFILQLQELVLNSENLSSSSQRQIHSIIISYAYLYAELNSMNALQIHITHVLQARKKAAFGILPEEAFNGTTAVKGLHWAQPKSAGRKPKPKAREMPEIPDDCLLDATVFSEVLEALGHDISNLTKPLPTPGSKHNKTQKVFVYKSSLNIDALDMQRNNESDAVSVTNLELESLESSPSLRRHSTIGGPGPNLTVDELKTVLDTEDDLIAQESRRKQIYQEFQSAPLETIMHKAHSRNELNNRLMEILGDEDEDEDDTYYTQQAVPIDGIKYPAMFVY